MLTWIQPNHLLGYRRTFVRLDFENVADFLAVRKVILPIAGKNKKNVDVQDAYAEVVRWVIMVESAPSLLTADSASAGFDFLDDGHGNDSRYKATVATDPEDHIVDIREYDVPYHVRVAIDKDIRIGKWYTVEAKHGVISIDCIEDRLERPDPVVLAFDIETTKLPLKFPDSLIDQIMMISYMIEGQV